MQVAALLIALCAAGLMGFASQRGRTCTVAAIADIVVRRRFGRIISLLEASVWVGCGFVLVHTAHHLSVVPSNYAVGLTTIAGGIVFGVGAYLNGACLLGTVARLGSGEWAYAFSPVGLFLGSVAAAYVSSPKEIHEASPALAEPAIGATAAGIFMVLRLIAHGAAIRRYRSTIFAYLWSPRVATTIIAISFFVAFLMVGDWDYADLIGGLARNHTSSWVPKSLLGLTLVAGAMLGGWTARSIKFVVPHASNVIRRLAGGGLMGFGSALVPGGNTRFILLDMPLLWPYAWLAFFTMCVTVYVLTVLMHRFGHMVRLRAITPLPHRERGSVSSFNATARAPMNHSCAE